MFQTHNSTDNQALLQSMLQRLKLQPGRESQASLNAPEPATAASTCLQDGERDLTDPKTVDTVTVSPQNGFKPKEVRSWGFGSNGISSTLSQMTTWKSHNELSRGDGQDTSSLEDRERLQTSHGYEYDKSVISFSSQKDNTDSDSGENGILGNAALPVITPKPTDQPLPVESLKDASVSALERSEDEVQKARGSSVDFTMGKNMFSDKIAVTTMGQNEDHSLGFTPRVYEWSLNSTDTGSKEFHMGNGEIKTWAENKNTTVVPASQNMTHNSLKRKQRLSETKMRRWTQKIKERWKERPGTLSKKGKEGDGRLDVNNMKENQSSPQNQQLMAETLINTSSVEGERTLPSLDTPDLSEASSSLSEELTNNGDIRPTSDSEFGLGSFSLLEEILTGQEWAKFLNPTQSGESTNQRPSGKTASPFNITPNPQEHDRGESLLIFNQQRDGADRWSFSGGTKSQFSGFGNAPISPDAFLPASMDTSEGKEPAVQGAYSESDQSEPMEHSRTQSVTEPGDSGLRHLTAPKKASYKKPADILDNPMLKSRIHLNRKRVYETQNMESDNEESISSKSTISGRLIDETGDSATSVYLPKSSLHPSSPLSPNSYISAPRSVLKHSISQDSQSSMETMTKRRRLEENRRVRFSEEVIAIEPIEVDLDVTGSDEDSEAEEDSVIEQESEEELQAAIEQLAPVRRSALPAWIQALKRKNTGRKWKYGL